MQVERALLARAVSGFATKCRIMQDRFREV